MFLMSKWNQTKIYNYPIERDYGTDYGMCCWYTPQINLTEVKQSMNDELQDEPDWSYWFQNVPKVYKNCCMI